MTGLFNKFKVTRADGKPTDPATKYFVLDYGTDPKAAEALRLYAELCEDDNPTLAHDLRRELELGWL